jgi:hypothetical protein
MVAKFIRAGFGIVAGLLVALVPELAHAQAPAGAQYQPYEKRSRGPGLDIGGRTGFGLPFGKSTGAAGADFDELSGGQVPLWFDLGLHFSEHFTVGMYLSYGSGISSDELGRACDSAEAEAEAVGVDLSCSSSDVRLGAQFLFHILPAQLVDPWVGVGTGWEWFSFTQRISAGGESASGTFTVSGWEMFNLQAGVDFKLADRMGLGPFVSFSNGSFGSVKTSCENTTCNEQSDDITNTASHQWLMFGAKFTARL